MFSVGKGEDIVWPCRKLQESRIKSLLITKAEIKNGGDTVYVSQVDYIPGQTRTVGTDADEFTTNQVTTHRVAITADKRFVAAAEFEDLVDLQSQIDGKSSPIREALLYGMQKQINDYLYGLVAASTATPDHSIASVSDLNAAALSAYRVLAGQAKWPKNKPWYGLVDPTYYMDIGDDTTLSSSLFNGGDAVVVAGEVASKRFGFNIIEDNALNADHGVFFYEDFMHFVTQQQVQVKISDQHANKRFGYVISVDLVGGAKLGISGDTKHIQVYNSAWSPVS